MTGTFCKIFEPLKTRFVGFFSPFPVKIPRCLRSTISMSFSGEVKMGVIESEVGLEVEIGKAG